MVYFGLRTSTFKAKYRIQIVSKKQKQTGTINLLIIKKGQPVSGQDTNFIIK